MDFLSRFSRVWKTVIAAIPSLVLLGTEIVQAIDNGTADGTLDRADVLTILLTTFTAIGVYLKANTPPAGEPADPNVSEVGPGADR